MTRQVPGSPSALTRCDPPQSPVSGGRLTRAAWQTGEQPAPGLVVRLIGSGVEAPLVVGPRDWKRIVGDPRSVHSIRLDCETGRLPTLPRAGGSGSHHRIAVAKALDELGVAYEIVQRSGEAG
jgi:hypothetical protein